MSGFDELARCGSFGSKKNAGQERGSKTCTDRRLRRREDPAAAARRKRPDGFRTKVSAARTFESRRAPHSGSRQTTFSTRRADFLGAAGGGRPAGTGRNPFPATTCCVQAGAVFHGEGFALHGWRPPVSLVARGWSSSLCPQLPFKGTGRTADGRFTAARRHAVRVRPAKLSGTEQAGVTARVPGSRG